MSFYIKVWKDERVTLMTQLGQVLCNFASTEEAMQACHAWYTCHEIKMDYENVTLEEAVSG